jgi:hypothetical protein
MVEWWNGGMAEWRNGGMAEWRNGRMAEWHNVRYEIVRNQNTESTQMPPWHGPSWLVLLKLFFNTCAWDKDHDIFDPGSRSQRLSLPRN